MFQALRSVAGRLTATKLPPAALAELDKDKRGLSPTDPGPDAVVTACTAWLCAAQDNSATADGGVARDFSLTTGWASSYPETTGYIIPTMIDLARRTGRQELHTRARRMLDWCVAIQYPDGGFQGGKIDSHPRVPVTFNTGQILLGLAAGAASYGDARYRSAMERAAEWLRETQDSDGCWRRHPTPFAERGDKAYETHVAWGMFEAERVAPGKGFGDAGLHQVEWALTKQLPNGWFASNCLTNPSKPLTHTIGYVLRGVIEAHLLSGRKDMLMAARRTADSLADVIAPDGYLPGKLDNEFRAAANFVCLTGSVQIAHCMLLLYRLTGEEHYLAAGRRANRYVRRTIALDGPTGIRGGVKGSFPVNGEYGQWQYLNWASKFCIDANLLETDLVRHAHARHN